jgi:endonuclease/exonuclease/phosphatase family metal-dependent hydrolase
MTLNIRRRVPHLRRRHPDRWDVRAPRLAALLQAERPALLGIQEALPDQAAFVAEALGHDSVGAGRARNGTGEGCQLLWDPRRLELLDWRQSALSTTPDVPGSRSWGGAFPRILVQAEFRDRSTDARFLAVNTHLDVLSARARQQGARAIAALVRSSALPAVLTGDLNAGDRSRAVAELLGDGTMLDAWAAAEERLTPPWGTYARYRRPGPGPRMDWIMVSPQVRVVRAGIRDAPIDGGWASDHLPVQAVVRMPA